MSKYYVFKGVPGRLAPHAVLIVTADRTGASLPKRRSGSWKYLRTITLNRGSSDAVIVSHDRAIEAITREGYYRTILPDDPRATDRGALSGLKIDDG